MGLPEPNFESFFNLETTRVVPGDWLVGAVDIQGSSEAIYKGKTREINLIGASSIAAIRNQFGPHEIPYIFGGDGATFLIPPHHLEKVKKTLLSVQRLALERLGLPLRVGVFSVESIYQRGGHLRHGFLSTSASDGFHFFRGNGLALAEAQLKSDQKTQEENSAENRDKPDLDGLSCKIDPFPSTKGKVLSVLVEPRVPIQEEDEVFQCVIKTLCLGRPLNEFKPISIKSLSRPWVSKNWSSEAKLIKPAWRVLMDNLIATFLFRMNLETNLLGSPAHYTDTLLKQSDWIKMDGTLRMVIEARPDEEKRLNDLLSELHGSGKIFYGVASSQDCVMTCHLQSAIADRHMHFIDGGDGGLTKAAINLKKQKRLSQ